VRASRARYVLLLFCLTLASCVNDLDRERRCRLAVRSLAAAPQRAVESELDKVVAFGSYALPDIEQAMHSAPVAKRLRLLRAIERVQAPEAIPFLRFLARWDTDDAVRRTAKQTADQLGRVRSAK